MTTSLGVTIMKNVTSATPPRHNECTLPHLKPPLDTETRVVEDAIDRLRGVKRVHGRHLRTLGSQMLPTFGSRRIDVIHHDVSARFQCSGKITRIQPDHT